MDFQTRNLGSTIENSAEQKIRVNLMEIARTVEQLNQLKPRQKKKIAGQVYKGWMYMFETITLITHLAQQPWEPGKTTSEVLINDWMEKISRLQQELAFYARRNNVRKINPRTKTYLTGLNTPYGGRVA